ncbi:MAG: MBL fold metallo-hydrolase [Eubacteriales bacterium]
MKIKKFVLGYVQTNTYVVMNEDTKVAFAIDPAEKPEILMDFFETEGYKLEAILLTHGHFDHIGAVSRLVEEYQVDTYAIAEEIELLATPELNLSTSIRRPMSVKNVMELQDGQELEVAGIVIKVLATPGHTLGGACYYIEENGIVFAGDTLFQNSVGRTDFPNGSHEQLIASIKKQLFTLPDDTIVYPGHMGETTIEHEKQNNPFVR